MAGFLTRMTRPKMWDGYPFLLSCAVGDLDDNILITIKGYDVANTLLATHQSTATECTDSVVHFCIDEVYGSLSGVAYITAYVESELGEVLTDTITIDVEEACINPVYLLARNTLGGALSWMFDFRQRVSYTIEESKSKKLLLNTNQLTQNQWDALQDFITAGQTYRDNIVEFTSSTIKTKTRIGQQVYVVSSTGSKIGVIATQTELATFTRNVKNMMEFEIEYPETFTP